MIEALMVLCLAQLDCHDLSGFLADSSQTTTLSPPPSPKSSLVRPLLLRQHESPKFSSWHRHRHRGSLAPVTCPRQSRGGILAYLMDGPWFLPLTTLPAPIFCVAPSLGIASLIDNSCPDTPLPQAKEAHTWTCQHFEGLVAQGGC